MENKILLVGVGGQGTILVSKILCYGFAEKGYDVKMSEIHGMAQRGGSVTTQIVYGDKVFSPSIEDGDADLLISFEKLEAVRYLSKLNPKGHVIINDTKIEPMPVLSGYAEYPKDLEDILYSYTDNVMLIKASGLAKKAGSEKATNIVMLGQLVKVMGLEDMDWKDIMKRNIPERFHEMNFKAFDLGYNYE